MKNTYKGKDGKLRFNDSGRSVHDWIARKKVMEKLKSSSSEIKKLFYALLFIISILSILGAKQFIIDKIINFFIGLIISAYYSIISNSIAEKSNLEFLKKYKYTINIWNFKFSTTAFAIAVMIIEWFLLK